MRPAESRTANLPDGVNRHANQQVGPCFEVDESIEPA